MPLLGERSKDTSTTLDLPLRGNMVQLWTADLAACLEPNFLEAYRRLLAPDEFARMKDFLFEQERNCYLVARALLRTVLGRCLGEAPEALRFAYASHGKPYLVHKDSLARRISFNLSHTRGLVLLGVSLGRSLGVDVEHVSSVAPLHLAQRFFSMDEARSLAALSDVRARVDRFWSLWTLKESVIKSTGLGLSMPLNSFSFQHQEHGRISLKFTDALLDSGQWSIVQWQATQHHLAAFCLRSDSLEEDPLTLCFRDIVPMRRERIVTPPITFSNFNEWGNASLLEKSSC